MTFEPLNQPVSSAVLAVAAFHKNRRGRSLSSCQKILVCHICYHGSFSQPLKAKGPVERIYIVRSSAAEFETFEGALSEQFI